jgi:Ca2+-binding RTX toxin-like protein
MALPGQQNEIVGTSGNDKLKGTPLDDTIYGKAGNDKINGKKGDDFLLGGTGDDRLKGQKGEDWLLGDNGSDRYKGGQGADQFRVDGSLAQNGDAEYISDLNFSQGDKLVLFGFKPGTFDDKDGIFETGVGNDLDITPPFPTDPAGYGGGAVIDSVADLVELVDFSSGVVARSGTGNTLILDITNGGVTESIYLKHLLNDYKAAGGDLLL